MRPGERKQTLFVTEEEFEELSRRGMIQPPIESSGSNEVLLDELRAKNLVTMLGLWGCRRAQNIAIGCLDIAGDTQLIEDSGQQGQQLIASSY